jgi:glycosyltransferase involved in cell wall biosynthesis
VAHHGPGQQPGGGERREPVHFLYVGDDEPRKNLGLLLDAYRLYREKRGDCALPLVLAGSAGADAPGVRVERRPDTARLAELYAGAVALVHPARLEGFGMTPLEALSTGTPVLAVRAGAVQEVCAGAAVYVDPEDPAAMAAEMERLERDPPLREELSRAGRDRALRFSWEHSARAHVRAYTLALEMTASSPGRR